tara:strand:- start:1514 stop:1666 length:153 start_codon:yes stop_codon:yes gene_type:complete
MSGIEPCGASCSLWLRAGNGAVPRLSRKTSIDMAPAAGSAADMTIQGAIR